MPLEEYIAETMTLLETTPDAEEIVVEAAKGFRFAERNGSFDEIYPVLNERMAAETGR
jgi:uncharacterized oxidoreductase